MRSVLKDGILCALLAACLVIGHSESAEAGELPAKLQANIFAKVLKFDRALPAGITIVAVYDADTKSRVLEVSGQLEDLGFSVKQISFDELGQNIAQAAVVYTESKASVVGELCAKHGVLSITGRGDFVKDGKLCVGVILKGDKPQILLSVGQAKLEHRKFAPALLKVVKLVRT